MSLAWVLAFLAALTVAGVVAVGTAIRNRGRHARRVRGPVAAPRRPPPAPPVPAPPAPGPTARVTRQCPNCGSYAIGADPPRFACRACAHRWIHREGDPWPDTVVRPWLWSSASPEPNPVGSERKA